MGWHYNTAAAAAAAADDDDDDNDDADGNGVLERPFSGEP